MFLVLLFFGNPYGIGFVAAALQQCTAQECYNDKMIKRIDTILQDLSLRYEFRALSRHRCYRRFLTMLSPKHRRAVAFVYVRDATLFVALKHPGFKMELDYNRDLLKDLWSMLQKHDNDCSTIEVKRVRIFHSRYHPLEVGDRHSAVTVPRYREKATGNFVLPAGDEALRKRFEKIASRIKEQRDA